MTIHAKSEPHASGRCRGLGAVESTIGREPIGMDTRDAERSGCRERTGREAESAQ